MSVETSLWLNTNTLIGLTDKRGKAWHWRAEDQGERSNHYAGAIPVEDVKERLFHWQALEGPVETTVLTPEGVLRVSDSNRKTIVRPDTQEILGVFKSGYQIHQYDQWLLDNVATILDDDLVIGSAGLLKGGAIAWVQVEVPDSIETPEGVTFRPNLLATTSLDGSIATTYKRTVTVVVCDNTRAIALGEQGRDFKVKHSSKSLNRIGEARDALGIVHAIADDFAAEVAKLCAVTVTDQQWRQFLEAHVALEDGASSRSTTLAQSKREALTCLWKNDNRVSPWKNTAYGVIQADNTYRQHLQTVRGGDRVERNGLQAVDGTVAREDKDCLDTLRKVLVAA